jgi:hypothetical protein
MCRVRRARFVKEDVGDNIGAVIKAGLSLIFWLEFFQQLLDSDETWRAHTAFRETLLLIPGASALQA